jgi:hypothetical protein
MMQDTNSYGAGPYEITSSVGRSRRAEEKCTLLENQQYETLATEPLALPRFSCRSLRIKGKESSARIQRDGKQTRSGR